MSVFHTPAERFLRDIIAIPSVTGHEGLIKDHLVKTFKEIGLEVELQHVDRDRYNAIGRLGNGPIKLMLCTHTDVIPPLDETLWHSPPFEATVKEGRIYGRGAVDAKGPLAAAMEALLRIKNTGVPLNGSVAIAAVVEEETGRSLGARKLMEKYSPEMGIIMEPTGLRISTAHKGAIRPVITIHGKSAHSSSPDKGVNAISIAARVLKELELYRRKVRGATDPMLGRSSLEVTMIQGGERINVVPEKCQIYVDRRLITGETVESAFNELNEVVKRIGDRTKADIDLKLLCSYPTSRTGENEKIAIIVKDALERKGLSSSPMGFPAGCDMHTFVARGIPTVILGPGGIYQAHTIDEYIEKEDLGLGVDVYEDIIKNAMR
jgi:acetylornithine deacetylase/succinyl-diaminopimelate desuccinylase family protein